jgi:hypothetical protein
MIDANTKPNLEFTIQLFNNIQKEFKEAQKRKMEAHKPVAIRTAEDKGMNYDR